VKKLSITFNSEKYFWRFIDKITIEILIVLLITLVGIFYRFINLSWDDGYLYHPDERNNIVAAAGRIDIPNKLDPEVYTYNGFSIYLTRLLAQGLHTITGNNEWVHNLSNISFLTRFISATASTLSIIVLFFITKRLVSSKAGLYASAIAACTVGFIQHAHYGVTESLLVFFLLCIILACLRVLEKNSMANWFFTAVISGIALGTKTSAFAFLLVPFVTWILVLIREKNKVRTFLLGGYFLFTIFSLFFISSPYTFLGLERYRESMKFEGGVVNGSIKVFYTMQFENTVSYIFNFKNMHWHLGPIIPLVGMIGILIWTLTIFRKKANIEALPMLIFALVYFLYVGSWYAKFIRYMMPLLPLLIISCVWLCEFVAQRMKRRLPLTIFLYSVFVLSFVWSTAFVSIYTYKNTRVAASQWIFDNIDSGNQLLVEKFDERLPTALKGNNKHYEFIEIQNYIPDSEAKLEDMAQKLAQADYLVISSSRMSGTVGQMKQTHPFTYNYYSKLHSRDLGYTLINSFESYPSLFGLTINDSMAEETFRVFDHPKVFIFQNTSKLDTEVIKDRLRN